MSIKKQKNKDAPDNFIREKFFRELNKQAWYMITPEIYGEANDLHADFLGYQVEDFKQAEVEELIPEENVEDFIRDNEVVFTKKQDSTVDQVIKDKQGEDKILQIYRTPIFDENENVVAVLCIAEDMTEWRRAEKNLYEKEELFQSIISTLPDLLLVLDEDGRYLRLWTGNNNILYAPRHELLGEKIEDVLPKQAADKIMENLQQALKSVSLQVFEYSLEVIGGKKHFEARLKAAGRDKVIMVVRDITDRIKAHTKIRELHNIAAELGSVQAESDIYKMTVEAAERILEFDVCSLDIVEEDKLVVKATSSGVPEGGSKTASLSDSGIAGIVYKTQETHITPDINNEPEAKPVDSKYKSALTVPVGEFGVFQAVATKKDKFGQKDLQMAELLISHTTTALKRLEAEKEIRYLGFHDKLTGLYNRKYIEEELERLDTPRQLPLSVITGDVNNLKLVNDAFGHDKGDELLKLIADILQDSCREEDIIGRFGGDEFIIILPDTDSQNAENIKQRILKNCRKTEKTEKIPVSIAVGIATKVDVEEDIGEVLKKADARMYEHKVRQGDKTREIIFDKLLQRLGEKRYESLAHCRNVRELAEKLAKKLGWEEKRIDYLREAAYIHDIGLITVENKILDQPRVLKLKEWKRIKKHAEIGYRIARSSDELSRIAPLILHHHERWDGKGYPRGLNGRDIPAGARIIAIADAYDVMLNNDIYKEKFTRAEAIKELKFCAGTQFDPDMVELFVREVI